MIECEKVIYRPWSDHPDNYIEWPESPKEKRDEPLIFKHILGHYFIDYLVHPKMFLRRVDGLSFMSAENIELWALLPRPIEESQES